MPAGVENSLSLVSQKCEEEKINRKRYTYVMKKESGHGPLGSSTGVAEKWDTAFGTKCSTWY